MTNKFELTTESITIGVVTLYRIIALKSFGTVKKGELGGFAETEENLSQDGNAWIGDDAKVYGSARVSDNAKVLGNAKVFGNAQVSDNAMVYEGAMVYGTSTVYDNAEVHGRAMLFDGARVSGKTKVFSRGGAAYNFDSAHDAAVKRFDAYNPY